jgi:hypothetical protein
MVTVTAPATSIERAHRAAVTTSAPEIATTLQAVLSRRITAYLAGVQDGKTVARWASGASAIREEEVERRVRTAYEIVTLLAETEQPEAIRAWFISLDPRLDGALPMDAIREGDLKRALEAARAFVANP